jgi:hypothetical protein
MGFANRSSFSVSVILGLFLYLTPVHATDQTICEVDEQKQNMAKKRIQEADHQLSVEDFLAQWGSG